MSWKDKPGERDGPAAIITALREALIRAALELIATKGTAGFLSPRRRFAGVSPARLPTFRDRDD